MVYRLAKGETLAQAAQAIFGDAARADELVQYGDTVHLGPRRVADVDHAEFLSALTRSLDSLQPDGSIESGPFRGTKIPRWALSALRSR